MNTDGDNAVNQQSDRERLAILMGWSKRQSEPGTFAHQQGYVAWLNPNGIWTTDGLPDPSQNASHDYAVLQWVYHGAPTWFRAEVLEYAKQDCDEGSGIFSYKLGDFAQSVIECMNRHPEAYPVEDKQ